MAGSDIEELATVPLPTPRQPEPSAPAEVVAPVELEGPAKERGRWWRGLTGSLAAGLVVLAASVLVIAVVCLFTGAPGPSPLMLVGHPVAAILALFAQRTADRFNGRRGGLAGLAVVLLVAAALVLLWWS